MKTLLMEDYRVKKISDSVKKDISIKNHARRLSGLPIIQIVVKTCTLCNKRFESAGNVTCGCGSKNVKEI